MTTNEDAFAAPSVFIDEDLFDDQGNALSRTEQTLASAYEALGRADLAECVRNGREYQRLSLCVGSKAPWDEIQFLVELFPQSAAVPVRCTEQEWIAAAEQACRR